MRPGHLGFNDAYHFSRRFAQAEKLSPRAWRRL
jgi:AraC-like DNA-binding protein